MPRRVLEILPLVLALAAAVTARADRATDIARIHLEAIGGTARIQALRSVRTTGTFLAEGERVRFTMLAARPGRLRVELAYPDRTLVQATDGMNPPWEIDPAHKPPVSTLMSPAAASAFTADAEFDDPLVSAESRGYQIDFAGEAEIEGRKLLRLLVTRHLTDSFHLLIDPATYFIVFRLDQRLTTPGQRIPILTRYDDFRPVAGVLVAHEIEVKVGGKVSQHARIDRIEANPTLPLSLFTRPDWGGGK